MNLTNAIYDLLAADANLTAAIGSYNGNPAIFSVSPVPEAAPLPFVVINPAYANVSNEALQGEEWMEVTRTISIYFSASGSAIAIELAANLLRAAIHHKEAELTSGDMRVLTVTASGPIDLPSDSTIYGRSITVTFKVAGV